MNTDEKIKEKSRDDQAREAFLDALANLGGRGTSEDDLVFEGSKLVIPETMDIAGAIDLLHNRMRADEEMMSFSRSFRFRPYDGARAMRDALFEAFGVVAGKAIHSFFGTQLPELVTVNVDVNQTEQIPWAALQIPQLVGCTLHLGVGHDPDYGQIFEVTVTSPRRWRHHIEGLFKLVEQKLATNSMYRGKAIDGQTNPNYIDLSGVKEANVIYSIDVLTQLQANVWTLIEHTDQMRRLGSPLKRAVLLEGPYGTGKTLAAYLTAQRAIANGWTFVYCRPGKDSIEDVMTTAQLYQPSVVFFEDIDTETSGEADATRMLDVFDGINAKGTEILCVLTTNHKERIHKGMLRPGRLDAVISIGALDTAGIRKLTEATIDETMLAVGADEWDRVGESMEGYMPAYCKEAIDRAVRYSVARNNGELDVIKAHDLISAADGLRAQLELMEGAGDVPKADLLDIGIGRTVDRIITERLPQFAVNGHGRLVDSANSR